MNRFHMDDARQLFRIDWADVKAMLKENSAVSLQLEKDEAITYLIEVKKDLELLRAAAATPGKVGKLPYRYQYTVYPLGGRNRS